ncbi:MBL fold metallo-hydrolase [Microbulbifer pacificus]|uniref:MBL fold metallo-hydrolase n=1 Tax=Microbulbifer pacificus TaxID=407164 RepID=UPI0018F88B66|nr:MBL fold metallo-hydrolase [Microbulbifer pacificus]
MPNLCLFSGDFFRGVTPQVRAFTRCIMLLALALPAIAEDQKSAQPSNIHHFSIGNYQATALHDGDIQLLNDASVIGVNQTQSEIAALLKTNHLPTDKLQLSIQGLLVRAGDRIYLFDTGAGDAKFADAGRLPEALAEAGIAPAQITDIFISHAHPDHVGGLLDDNGSARFTNAKVHMAAPEWQALQGDANNAVLAAAIKSAVKPFAPGSTLAPGVTAVQVEGHTPGHSAYEVSNGNARLLYIGDTAHHFVVSVQRPRWTIAFDGDAPVAEASRAALLARAADDAALQIYSPHFPFPGLGRFQRKGNDIVWVPAE